MRILGVDYGLKKIGLARAEFGLAEPLAVVKQNKLVVGKISDLCQEYQVEKIVVGLPEGKLLAKAKKFGQKLGETTQLPVVFQDETLTSKEAVDKMLEAGKGLKARREKEDAVAAAIILQNYLDSNV